MIIKNSKSIYSYKESSYLWYQSFLQNKKFIAHENSWIKTQITPSISAMQQVIVLYIKKKKYFKKTFNLCVRTTSTL